MSKQIIFTDTSDSVLAKYLKDVSKYKLISAEETNSLIKKAQQGDEQAKNKVVNSNLRFCITIAKKYQNRGIPLMDLISSANEGLIKAVYKYDEEKGSSFLSYSLWWIKQCIYNNIYSYGKSIRLPVSQRLLVIKITDATSKFVSEHQRNPSPKEISEITNIPEKDIDFLAQYSNKEVSVDDYIGGDEENNQVCDVIPDKSVSLEDDLDSQFKTKGILDILDKLDIRERDVLCMTFGIGMDPVDPKLICEMYGLGGERIRQIKEKALGKLRKHYASNIKSLLC